MGGFEGVAGVILMQCLYILSRRVELLNEVIKQNRNDHTTLYIRTKSSKNKKIKVLKLFFLWTLM